MSNDGVSEPLFSSENSWNEVPGLQKEESGEILPSSSSIVTSGTLSDPGAERNYVRGFAQRATEPDVKQTRAKGPHIYEKRAFQDGKHFYEKERIGYDKQRTSSRDGDEEDYRGQRDDESKAGSDMQSLQAGYADDRRVNHSSSRSLRDDHDGDFGDYGISMIPQRSSQSQDDYLRGEDYTDRPRHSSDSPPGTGQRGSRRRRHSRGPESADGTYEQYSYFEPEDVDVSKWGREKEDSDMGRSMSSGLSPRESRPRPCDFEPEKAQRTLAWAGEKYTRAQIMRREGTAPEAYGIMEDMPTRMAYQQLNVLAGMAGKVQSVIEHNRKVFERRVLAADKAEMSRAFKAWRAARYGTTCKQQLLARAVARLSRGILSRSFLAWKDKFNLVDKFLVMKRKGLAINRRGRIRRAFLEWRALTQERWWKDQLVMRDNDVDRLNRLCRKYENRPVVILGNRRMRACLGGWYEQARERRRRRNLLTKGLNRMKLRKVSAAFCSWFNVYDAKRSREQYLKRTIGRLKNNQLARVWSKWIELIGTKKRKQLRLEKAMRFWKNLATSKAWTCWLEYVKRRNFHKSVVTRWTQIHMGKAFRGWVHYLETRKRYKLILTRAIRKMKLKSLYEAWDGWLDFIEHKKWMKLSCTKTAMEEEVVRLKAENDRLRRDNERFVRLIDSGEWGRGRVAELVQAGEVMKGERDALMKLIGSLRREYEAVQEAKVAQESELSDLKRRITNVGGAGRNRLLIKGGSSFNGLVRKMKQEMAEAAASGHPVDPSRIYEVNRLSMDHVQVFPDGELQVHGIEPLAAKAGRFSRPIPIAGGLSRPASPLQQARIPKSLQGVYSPGTPPQHGSQAGRPPASRLGSGRQAVEALDKRLAAASIRKPGMASTVVA